MARVYLGIVGHCAQALLSRGGTKFRPPAPADSPFPPNARKQCTVHSFPLFEIESDPASGSRDARCYDGWSGGPYHRDNVFLRDSWLFHQSIEAQRNWTHIPVEHVSAGVARTAPTCPVPTAPSLIVTGRGRAADDTTENLLRSSRLPAVLTSFCLGYDETRGGEATGQCLLTSHCVGWYRG